MKGTLGNNHLVFRHKLLWDMIYRFEFKFGKIEFLDDKVRHKANFFGNVIKSINKHLSTK